MEPTPTDDWAWIAPLLHLSDSALPVGAYAHSFGLEGMCQMGMVHDIESFSQFLQRDVAHALHTIDLPLVAHAHAAMMDARHDRLAELDQLSWALRPSRQNREATSKIGRQQFLIFERTWGAKNLPSLPHYQSPTIVGLTGALSEIPVEAALMSLAYQTYSALVQASLKLLPVGPGSTQRLLFESLAAIRPTLKNALDLPASSLGSFNPVWDIAASRHERAPARLFIS